MRDHHFSKLLAQLFRRRRNATYPGLFDGPPSPLFCLAPDWVFRAAALAGERGGLLPHLFIITLIHRNGSGLFIFCDTVRHRGFTHGAPA